ncbi:vicilin-like seed storage protein At2g18540 [Microcaecilia unicolor]|uniref:Vicilin-like seed storage protein At2g18540 n=1 Tax=Microcaecilia unicolor TaxID=1415580 RepID=A0A6P7YGA2_9AMPH|nr:vicilin-like seed storage protein At2g18540 [Microcaecilia unicolor]
MEPPVQVQTTSHGLGTYCTPGSTRKRQVRFSARHDIMLLREVIHQNPFALKESGRVWAKIGEELTAALQGEYFEVDGRRCRERTALLLDYYKRQNFAGLRRCGTESLYMEKEDLLHEVLELESEKRLMMTTENRYKEPQEEAVAVTITEETLRKAQEDSLGQQPEMDNTAPSQCRPHRVQETKEEVEDPEEAPVPKRTCQGCCQAYSEILLLLERRAEMEQRLREEELAVRREELEVQKEKIALEREQMEAERREREKRFELESQERQVILDILKEKMMKK